MLVIGIIFCIIIVVIIILLVTSKSGENVEVVDKKKEFAIPPQKRYPFMYIKACHFYTDAVSRFAYSEDEIDQFLKSLDESFDKGDYVKTIKLSSEVIKILPKSDKIWLRRISAIFMDIMTSEKCWSEKMSRLIVNACFGFLQCYETVIEKSIAVKHVLLPTILKNTEELIKYQNRDVTKYHNFEVYNMLLNLYYVIPYKEILGLLSNSLLDDKTDKDFESDPYVKQTLKSLLKQVDILRTRNTSRLQETFDSKKITNCTLITDERIDASIIAFELTFEPKTKKEKIEAAFFDESGNEFHFGRNIEDRFVDVFEVNSDIGFTVKEEIVLLTEENISSVRLSVCKDKTEKAKSNGDIEEVPKSLETESKDEDSNAQSKKESDEIKTDKTVTNQNAKSSEKNEVEDKIEDFEPEKKPQKPQMLVYPAFDNIKYACISDTQFVGLKENNTVIALGTGDRLKQQTNTWRNIDKVYVKNDAVYGVRKDGTVIYAGNSEYEGIENIYSWENIDKLSLGEKHLVAVTKNATMYALGENSSGECDVDEWYDVVQVDTAYHTVGVCKDGKVLATGENNFGECDVKSWQDVVQVAVGDFYTLGLTSSGKVLATGLNSCGQCNVTEWLNIKKIYAKGNMSVGLRFDGKVVTAGRNSYHYGDVKNWSRIRNIVMSNNRIIGIEQDGTVHATGKPYKNFINGNWHDVRSVIVNNENIVAINENGTLISNGLVFGNCVSSNLDSISQICDDVDNNRIAMVSEQGVLTINNKIKAINSEENTYPTFYDVKKVSLSATHAIMLKNDGTASFLRFGDGVTEMILGWENLVDVEAGNGFLMGLDISGRVFATGDNDHGQCEVSEWHDIVKIRASEKRAIGMTIDGKLFMSGISESGEDDFIKISKNNKDFALTSEQTMILTSDGNVKVTYYPTGVNTEAVKSWKNIKKVVARGNNFLCLSEEGKVYSTIDGEAEISEWEEVDDIDASGDYVWAVLKS